MLLPRSSRSGIPEARRVVERERRAEDVAAVACEQAHQLVHRRHDRIGRLLGAGDGNTQRDEELFHPSGTGRDEHAGAIRAHDVGVRDATRAEEEVAGVEVDPLLAHEHGDLTLEDVERLVLVVVDMEGGSAATRGSSVSICENAWPVSAPPALTVTRPLFHQTLARPSPDATRYGLVIVSVMSSSSFRVVVLAGERLA